MKAFLHDSTMHWKTKINYKSQAKYIVICPGWKLSSRGVEHHNHANKSSQGRILPPFTQLPAGSEHRQRLFFPITKRYWLYTLWMTLLFIHRTWILKKEPKKCKLVFHPPVVTPKNLCTENVLQFNYAKQKTITLQVSKWKPSSVSLWSRVPHTKSSVQTWDTQQSPHTIFSAVSELGCFTAADQSWHHHWEQGTWTGAPLSAGSFKKPFIFYSLWKKLCYKHGLGLALFSQTQNILSPFLKAPARNKSMQPLPGHPQHREAMSP